MERLPDLRVVGMLESSSSCLSATLFVSLDVLAPDQTQNLGGSIDIRPLLADRVAIDTMLFGHSLGTTFGVCSKFWIGAV